MLSLRGDVVLRSVEMWILGSTRAVGTLALVLALLVLGAAGQAAAVSSMSLVYLGGSTVDPTCPVNAEPCVHAREGDVIRFAVVLAIDSDGLSAFGLDLRWDPDGEDELDLVAARQRGSLIFLTPNPSPPPDTLVLGDYTVSSDNFRATESGPGQAGYLVGFDALSASYNGPFIADTSFRIGTLAFQVTDSGNAYGGPDIETGFFRTDGGALMGNAAFDLITPNFGSFSVDRLSHIPEPRASLLIALGLAALAHTARASRPS
jgi:hypothetical protein